MKLSHRGTTSILKSGSAAPPAPHPCSPGMRVRALWHEALLILGVVQLWPVWGKQAETPQSKGTQPVGAYEGVSLHRWQDLPGFEAQFTLAGQHQKNARTLTSWWSDPFWHLELQNAGRRPPCLGPCFVHRLQQAQRTRPEGSVPLSPALALSSHTPLDLPRAGRAHLASPPPRFPLPAH